MVLRGAKVRSAKPEAKTYKLTDGKKQMPVWGNTLEFC